MINMVKTSPIITENRFKGVNFERLHDTYRLTDSIIQQLTPEATLELFSSAGSEDDIEIIMDTIVDEAYSVLYGSNKTKVTSETFGYLDRFSESVDEALRCEDIAYFVTNVMPEFEVNWHHLDWFNIIKLHKYFCVEASRDHGKCLKKGEKVIMYDGSIRLVENVKIGEYLLGVDGKKRKVLNVYTGKKNLVAVKQTRGDDYIVNEDHIMTLYKKNRHSGTNSIIDIDLTELRRFISKREIKRKYNGFKVLSKFKEQKINIEPYFLGLWLGDGNSHNCGVTTSDKEIVDYLKEYCEKKLGLIVRLGNGKKYQHLISTGKDGGNNVLQKLLRKYNLLKNKHIPEKYIVNSKENRLQLLAGLLDSDGYLHCPRGNSEVFYFSNTNKILIDDVKRLCDSLGYYTNLRYRNKFVKQHNRFCESWSLTISGEIWEIPTKLIRKQAKRNLSKQNHKKPQQVLKNAEITMNSGLTFEDLGVGEYVGITIDKDKRFLLADGTVIHNSFCFSNAYPIWKMYKYKPTTMKQKLNPRGFLFSFSMLQAIDLLTIIKDSIEGNEILRARLYNKEKFGKTDITCLNRARLTVKGFGSAVRGAHPYWIMVDDGLKDNVLYSKDQRDKSINYFHSVIMNMIVPGGQVGVVGTPFHNLDLYGDLKTKPNWKVFEYPSIFPDGSVLWENRYSFWDLMEKRKSQGNLIFSREMLCRPITSDSTIFPMEILNNAILRMENYKLVTNRESFPIKFNRVVAGCDFAISGSVGADFSVYTVWGIDEKECMWLLYALREKGLSFSQQIAHLKNINMNFRPDVMVLESNNFQQIFVNEADKQGLPVVPHVTTGKKNDLKEGWASLALLFERGAIKFPYGDQKSKDFADMAMMEFSSVAFTEKNGLCSTDGHDDICSSTWLSSIAVKKIIVDAFNFTFI